MYKKFLVSMLLMSALVGCNHQASDNQGEQSDTAMPPVQDQMANPANSSQSDDAMPVSPQAVEPNQTPPSDAMSATPVAPPATSTDNGMTNPTTPAEPANNDKSANSPASTQ